MVRKDVKIGAVVLAILLAVIVVYVLVVPGGAPIDGQPVVNADDAFKEQMKRAESGSAYPPSGTTGDGQAPVTTITPANQIAGGQPAANDPFADSGEKWMLALNTGSMPQGRLKSNPGTNRGPSQQGIIPSGDGFRSPPADNGTAAGNAPISIQPDDSIRPTVKTHTVQPGDSIARIAETVYGSQVYYKAILTANPGVDPKRLKPGTVLQIPDVKEVKANGGADDPSPAPALAKTEYRIVSGDSMHGIAKKLYGKSDMWEQIYDLNKARIGSDPAKLKVGMILKLPTAPTHN
ncbi:MAG TPA: LysM peptidoglycan-binding domain-containing protein [Tepidisphaeraceae bacterium]|nr:LysM peptidoglycan-binding domain-containing protein [Tepidisphaeraceae bacterium]